jgi:hypothetical protein
MAISTLITAPLVSLASCSTFRRAGLTDELGHAIAQLKAEVNSLQGPILALRSSLGRSRKTLSECEAFVADVEIHTSDLEKRASGLSVAAADIHTIWKSLESL